jgi:hypothetical protein
MKKGEEALTFVFSMIFLVIILFVFFALFSIDSINKKDYVIMGVESAKININLINYLRTPLDDNTTIYDLIVNSYYKDDYDDLERETNNVFNKIYNKDLCPLWKINGKINNNKFFEYESEFDIRKYTLTPNPRGNLFLFTTSNRIYPKSFSIDIKFPELKKDPVITLTEGCVVNE